MNLFDALGNPHFWAYTASVAGILAACWAALFWLNLRGQRLGAYRRVFWTWVLMAAIVTPAVLLGQEAFSMVVASLALLACKEFARATGLYDDWLFTGLLYLLILAVNLTAVWPGYDVFVATPIYAIAVLCLLPILRNQAEGMLQRVALSVMAFVYFGFFLAHLSLLGGGQQPRIYGYVFFLIYGTATSSLAGWMVSRWWGRHPLVTRISPRATWEGAAASLTWACLWSVGLGLTLPALTWPAMMLTAVILGLMGPLGDLVMRYILHDLGLKAPVEHSEFVPYLALAHLNRLIFAAPLFFRLVHWFDPAVFVAPSSMSD